GNLLFGKWFPQSAYLRPPPGRNLRDAERRCREGPVSSASLRLEIVAVSIAHSVARQPGRVAARSVFV
ncbi:MAG: hypothetical protein, partial [Olavius algarvensis Gamma 1 endosymbiont]